ncbi:MAG: head-tail adaptor protein [Succinivibrio sp.]
MSVSKPLSGELNKRISIYSRADIPEDDYSFYEDDTLIQTCWAKIENVGGAIYYGSLNTNSAVTHRVWVRAIKGKTDSCSISVSSIIKYKDRYFKTVRVTDLEGIFTVIECCEVGAIKPIQSKELVGDAYD